LIQCEAVPVSVPVRCGNFRLRCYC
jgi:hypothetical protein